MGSLLTMNVSLINGLINMQQHFPLSLEGKRKEGINHE